MKEKKYFKLGLNKIQLNAAQWLLEHAKNKGNIPKVIKLLESQGYKVEEISRNGKKSKYKISVISDT